MLSRAILYSRSNRLRDLLLKRRPTPATSAPIIVVPDERSDAARRPAAVTEPAEPILATTSRVTR